MVTIFALITVYEFIVAILGAVIFAASVTIKRGEFPRWTVLLGIVLYLIGTTGIITGLLAVNAAVINGG
jgi:hypothetical protein